MLHPDGPAVPRRGSAAAVRLLGGAVAAGLGLGALTVLVVVLWISSPYPDSGPHGALHIAVDLWLLAHGAGLVRTGSGGGASVPVELTPLLLTLLPAWLLWRATRGALAEAFAPARAEAVRAAAWVSTGYLLVGAVAVWYATDGPVRVDLLSAGVRLPLVTVGVTGLAAWAALGRPAPALPAVVRPVRGAFAERRGAGARRYGTLRVLTAAPQAVAVLRTTVTGVLLLVSGGAVLLLAGLAWHTEAVHEALGGLTGSWSGALAVLLLTLALAPNAAVWAAAYGLGPGFTLGAGSVVAPLGAGGMPRLPHFPLLAALPGEGPGSPLTWSAAAVPLVAAVAMGRSAAQAAVPLRGARDSALTPRVTAALAGLAAVGCALVMALLALLAGGALGNGQLAHFGPVWWLVAPATLAWAAGVGVPTALAIRAWRLRPRRGATPVGAGVGRGGAPPGGVGPRAEPAGAGPSGAGRGGAGRGGVATGGRGPGGAHADAGTGAGSRSGWRRPRRAGAAPAPQGAGGRARRAEQQDDWHSTAARRTRWAALKEASGGLVPDFPPRRRD